MSRSRASSRSESISIRSVTSTRAAVRITEPRTLVAQQAGLIAAAWSPPGAPASWRLTAAQFEVLESDPELLAIAATIPAEKLPPLLFQAAATFLVLQLEPQPLRSWFPRVGEAQPPFGAEFADEYRGFCLDHRDRLLDLCARHRYQMNEVGRCADLLPALAPAIDTGREIALVDIGTGAGLALHLDRYLYRYRGADGRIVNAGSVRSSVEIDTKVRGSRFPALPTAPARITDRIGIDIEPLDLDDPGVRSWLAACIPQEADAVTRFHHAVQVASENAAKAIRGDARAVLPELLAAIRADRLVCLVDSYVHVFFSDEDLRAFRDIVDQAGAERDLYWVSVDPLVPMGNRASRSVLGVAVPETLVERNRREGVFGVIGRLSYRRGKRDSALLGIAHPGAAWLEWLGPVPG